MKNLFLFWCISEIFCCFSHILPSSVKACQFGHDHRLKNCQSKKIILNQMGKEYDLIINQRGNELTSLCPCNKHSVMYNKVLKSILHVAASIPKVGWYQSQQNLVTQEQPTLYCQSSHLCEPRIMSESSLCCYKDQHDIKILC